MARNKVMTNLRKMEMVRIKEIENIFRNAPKKIFYLPRERERARDTR